jgi:hypothetical protein
MPKLFVINSKGEREAFSRKKVYRSAKRSGASNNLARKIAEIIEKQAYPGIKTSVIFEKIKKLLKKESPGVALRFSLKEGMRKLGPTGFPFEKYVSDILENLGYQVKINQHLPGKCISSYETDFIAKKENIVYLGECKYRQYFGERIGSPDALSNHARFFDILSGNYFKSNKYQGFTIKSMLVTNTKFSSRTIDYCSCVGTELLGWNYPKNKGLEYFIDSKKLYPITILPSLKGHLKDIFVEKKIMLAKHLLEMDIKEFVKRNKLPLKQVELLLKEAEYLLQ